MDGAALIVGCARNVGPSVDHVLSEMHRLGARFSDYEILVYENDSTDGTLSALRRHEGPRVRILSETNVRGPRTVRLARARNILLDAARAMADRFRWLIVMDMDFVNRINMHGIDTAVASWDALRWNACTAVTIKYYDFFALRLPGFMDYNCRQDKEAIARRGSCFTYDGTFRPDRVLWVDSAFNGLAIHRMDAVARSSDAKYKGEGESGEEVCEHVPFYKALKRVIIHPDLVAQTWTKPDCPLFNPVTICLSGLVLLLGALVVLLLRMKRTF